MLGRKEHVMRACNMTPRQIKIARNKINSKIAKELGRIKFRILTFTWNWERSKRWQGLILLETGKQLEVKGQ